MISSKLSISILCLLLFSFESTPDQPQLRKMADNTTTNNKTNSNGFGVRCLWVDDQYNLFDLKEIAQEEDYSYYLDFNYQDKKWTINYSFCDNLRKDSKHQVIMYLPNGGGQKNLAGPIENKNTMGHLNSKNISVGVFINLTKGDESFQVNYEIECEKNGNQTLHNMAWYLNGDIFTLKGKSSAACPKINFYNVWNFIMKYKIIFAAIILLIGLFEMVCGFFLVKVTMFIISMIIITLILFVLFFQVILPSGGNRDVLIWVVLVISLIIGAFFGFLLATFDNIVFGVVLGVATGYFLGTFLFNLFFSSVTWHPTVIQWIVIIVCMAALAVLSIFLYDFVIICCTSFIGAYLFIRAISLYAGGFPEETVLMDYVTHREKEKLKELLTWRLYIYLVFIILLTIGAIILQFIIKNKTSSEKEEPENEYKKVGPLNV